MLHNWNQDHNLQRVLVFRRTISCRDVAVGTTQGNIIALCFEEKEKKERGGKVVLDMSAIGETIKGIAQLPLPQERLLLLVSTSKRLYAFTGSSSLEKLGESYQVSPSELPCPSCCKLT